MYNEDLFNNKDQFEEDDQYRDLPSNKMLILVQFTEQEPKMPNHIEGLTCLNEIFNLFNPSCKCSFHNENGDIIEETIYFRSLQDFDAENIISQSRHLMELSSLSEQLAEMIKKLQSNKLWSRLMSKHDKKVIILNLFQALITELSEGYVPRSVKEEFIAQLTEFGGFYFLPELIEDLKFMDPANEKGKVFLYDSNTFHQRWVLKKQLEILMRLLSETENMPGLIAACVAKLSGLKLLLYQNLSHALATCRSLETSYRAMSIFIANTGFENVTNMVLVNASLDQLMNIDEPTFIEYAAKVLKDKFDRIDLTNNFSMVVIPGFLGRNTVMNKWAKMVNNNKAVLITDFMNLDHAHDVLDLFDDAEFAGSDDFKSSVIMTCNYLLARRKNERWKEEDDLYVPGSVALAGKMYNFSPSRVLGGMYYGNMEVIEGVRFDVRMSELIALEKSGLITMMNKSGKVRSYSARTLYNGQNKALRVYSTVRLFDHLSKVFIHLINSTTFEAWTPRTQQVLLTKIMRFLNSIQGHEMLIRDFNIIRFERDNEINDMLRIEIRLDLAGNREFVFAMKASLGYEFSDLITEYKEL